MNLCCCCLPCNFCDCLCWDFVVEGDDILPVHNSNAGSWLPELRPGPFIHHCTYSVKVVF